MLVLHFELLPLPAPAVLGGSTDQGSLCRSLTSARIPAETVASVGIFRVLRTRSAWERHTWYCDHIVHISRDPSRDFCSFQGFSKVGDVPVHLQNNPQPPKALNPSSCTLNPDCHVTRGPDAFLAHTQPHFLRQTHLEGGH